jgi:hypothetical protein
MASKVDGETFQSLIIFKSRVDQEFGQCGDGKRDVKATENITTENLTKEITVTISNSASKSVVLYGAFLWSRWHRVKLLCFIMSEGGLRLSSKGGLTFGGCLPGMALENPSKVGFGRELDVISHLENIITIE